MQSGAQGPGEPYPNLLIIGAMKSATTTLHKFLLQHPDVFMTHVKEPSFFVGDPSNPKLLYGRGDEAYRALFPEAGTFKFAGESSTNYTKAPIFPCPAHEIHAWNPDAKLIYMMRDPIRRAISHYWHAWRDFGETRPMLTAFRRDRHYTDLSDYAYQLAPYLELFPRDNILLLTMEGLKADLAGTVERVWKWLGIPRKFEQEDRPRELNRAPELIVKRRLRKWVGDIEPTHRTKRRLISPPRNVVERVRRHALRAAYNVRDLNRYDTRPSEDYLRPILLERTAALEPILGFRPPEWTTLYAEARATSAPPASVNS